MFTGDGMDLAEQAFHAGVLDARHQCRWCYGEGKIARANSEAVQDCENCDGTGQEPPCEDCGGAGEVFGGMAARHTDDGMLPCPSCPEGRR